MKRILGRKEQAGTRGGCSSEVAVSRVVIRSDITEKLACKGGCCNDGLVARLLTLLTEVGCGLITLIACEDVHLVVGTD
jgi:hypothetical protein